MVEVKVTVHHQGHILKAYPDRTQRLGQRPAVRSVMRLGFRVDRAQAGVEQDQAFIAVDQVRQRGLDPRLRAGLGPRTDEVAEIKSLYTHAPEATAGSWLVNHC